MSSLGKDFAFAIRTLRRSPVFALTAIITIALGIGATTAIFSVVNAVLLRPLPYAHHDRLVFIQGDLTARNVSDFPMAPGDFPDLRRDATQLDEIAAVVTFRQPLLDERAEPQMLKAAGVTTNFFRTLGVRVAVGRDFVDEDGQAPPPADPATAGAAPTAPAATPPLAMSILSYEFWQRQFGGDENVVGRRLTVGGQTAEVIGVLEPRVELFWPEASSIDRQPDIYTAMRINFANASRVNVFLRAVARLKPGGTIPQAQEQVNAIVKDLRQRFPIKETAGLKWRVEPMQEYVVAKVQPAIVTLMGAVGFVLLIACANVANLLLVRTSQRERELAVRSALGGARAVLLRQMLVESLVISVAGSALGLTLASLGIDVLTAVGPENLPAVGTVSLDRVVLGFTVLAAVTSAFVFGIVPALRASRVDVADILRSGGRSPGLSSAGKWLRASVVTAEVALAFVLLVGSGLMIRSFVALQRSEPGFDPSGVLTFFLPNFDGPTPDARAAFVRRMHDRLAALPGVTAVSAANPLPLEGSPSNVRYGPEAAATDPTLFQQADYRVIQPNYFAVIRTRLLDGRAFTDADNVPDLNRVIVDDVFARKLFAGQSAVGRQFLARTGGPEPQKFEIVGVVEHQRNQSLSADGRETIYVTDGQNGFGATARWLLRTNGDPARLGPAVRAAVREIDSRAAIADLHPLSVFVDRARAPTRFALVCIGIFAVVAAVLASVGLYGVLSTVVRQRSAEIGVRMAFGASAPSVFRLVVGQGMRLSAAGIAIGLLAAFALTRVMRKMLVNVSPTDPLTFGAIAALFLLVAALACFIPARRASRLDPLEALREE